MTDYKVNFDVGYFGTDNPATAGRRARAVRRADRRQEQGTSTSASSPARTARTSRASPPATGCSAAQMSGAAPGAKIVSSACCLFIAGCTAHALLEGMIYVAKQANVDVINMSIGGLPALNDGNNARCDALRPADRAVRTCRCSSRRATAARA